MLLIAVALVFDQPDVAMEAKGAFVFPGVKEMDNVSETGAPAPGLRFTVRRKKNTYRVDIGSLISIIQDPRSVTFVDAVSKRGLTILREGTDHDLIEQQVTEIFPLWPQNYGPSPTRVKFLALEKILKIPTETEYRMEKQKVGDRTLLQIRYRDLTYRDGPLTLWSIWETIDDDEITNAIWACIDGHQQRGMAYFEGKFAKTSGPTEDIALLPKDTKIAQIREKDFQPYADESFKSKLKVAPFRNLDDVVAWLKSLYARTMTGARTLK